MDNNRGHPYIRAVIAVAIMLLVAQFFFGASSVRSIRKLVVLDEAHFKGSSVAITDSGLVFDSLGLKTYESDISMASLTHGSSIPTVEEMGTTEIFVPSWSGTLMNMVSGTKLIPPDSRLNDSISLILRFAVNSNDTAHFVLRLKYRLETDSVIISEFDTLFVTGSADIVPHKFYSITIGKIYYQLPKTTIVFKLSRETANDNDTYTDKIFTSLFSLKFRRDRLGLNN